MKIVVLAGGLSPERDVSLTSGSLIANSLAKSSHEVVLLDAYVGIESLPTGYISKDAAIDSLFSKNKTYTYSVKDAEPDLDALVAQNGGRLTAVGPNVIDICKRADVVFIALHGASGENGQIQATFDSFGITYTGSGYTGSLLAMDKDLSKRILLASNLPTAEWVYVDSRKPESVSEILEKVGLPCVVKPCSCGSSVGISIVHTKEELLDSLKLASKYEAFVVVERKITGREFSVGVVDGVALPAIEIIPKAGFYDYKNKYQSGLTEEICPAHLSKVQAEKLASLTVEVFNALRLNCYARIDFLLEENSEAEDKEQNCAFYCLEANTLPGMTPTSLLPQEAAAVGINYDALCEKLAMLALTK